MITKFKTKQLIFITLIGVLLFLMELLIATVLDVIIGVPGAGFLVVIIFFGALAVVGGLVVRKFGTFTLMSLIYSVLAIPTPVFGPPGFYKVLAALVVGLFADVMVSIFGYRKIGYYLGLVIGNLMGLVFFAAAFVWLGFPESNQILSQFWFLFILYAIEAAIGVWLGFWIYGKIKNKKVVREISN